MRLTYLIRSVNSWLGRVAYERDSWDEWLAHAASEWDWRIAIVLRVAQFVVWLTRKLLAGLAIAGHAIGTFMLREMELDADRYEARLAGSDVFEATALRLRVLSVARLQALELLGGAWREGRLAEDLAALVAALADRLSPQARAEIEAQGAEVARASVFDTHPPDGKRIASAKAEGAVGILRLEAPAAALLSDGSPLPQRATLAFYRDESEISARAEQLRPVREILERHDTIDAELQVAERYFGDLFDLFSPLAARELRPSGGPGDLASALELLEEARAIALRLRPTAPPPAPAAEGADAEADGETEDDGDSEAAATPPPDPAKLAAAQAAAREHLCAALALLAVPSVRARVEAPERMEQEIDRLGATLGVLVAEGPALKTLATLHDELVDVFAEVRQSTPDTSLAERLTGGLARIHVQTQQLEHRLARVPYPFEHGRGAVSMTAYVTQDLPMVDGTTGDEHRRTGIVLRRLQALHQRALGRLAVLAERLERAAEAPAPPD